MVKKFIAGGVLLVFCVIAGLFLYPHCASVVVFPSVGGGIRPYADKLAAEVNKKLVGKLGAKYTLYATNFEKGQSFPEPSLRDEKTILWLGSTQNYIPDLEKFDIILASTPLLRDFLKNNYNVQAYYLPLFTADLKMRDKEGEFIALIGNPPFIEEILVEKAISYQRYHPLQGELIEKDMNKFLAVFTENTALNETSIDLNPIFYTLAAQKIPLAIFWSWPDKEEALNLFNDKVNFYLDKADAERLIDNLLQKPLPADIARRAQDARRLVKQKYFLKTHADNLAHLILTNEEKQVASVYNSLNFDIPVAVGHTASGDFWLASDLSSYFHQKKWNTSFTYFNSLYKYKTAVNVVVRGFAASDEDMIGETNIFYLAYPQLGDDVSQKVIDDREAYINSLLGTLKKYDAVASASESLAKAFNERGVKAYYIPQFTNEKRFYPDYHDDLKSEVLFVGINAPYRRAAKIALEHKLPITIYGPHWGDSAKGEYVDNRVLRKYYSSAKIVLNDTRREMLVHGVISNRIFDASACGSLVISDYMPEIEEIYGDSVPMWKTEEELVALIKYYLDPAHEAERLEKAKRAQEITLQNFTVEKTAKRFEQIIRGVKNEKEKPL